MNNQIFPLDRLEDIRERPDDFRLLERVPLTGLIDRMPVDVSEPVGDEAPVVVLDLETTGFDQLADEVIEVGLVRVLISPSRNRLVRVERVGSYYRDPGFPVPEVITQITGIDDAKVAGQQLDLAELATWFADDPLVVAHSASFDRPFFEKTVPGFDRLRWGCTATGIPWSEFGFEGRKLEYLLLKLGYFYTGHRASIDCLAVAWLLVVYPEAIAPLLKGAAQLEYFIQARGAPFDVKDSLKARGYRWNAPDKVWQASVPEPALTEEKAWLAALYYQGDQRAVMTPLDARSRFRS
jgi:DNA polymerase-3 subunit epsilon